MVELNKYVSPAVQVWSASSNPPCEEESRLFGVTVKDGGRK